MTGTLAGLLPLLSHLAGGLPLFGGLMLVLALNLAREVRSQQWPMPGVAAGYAVMAIVVLYPFNSRFDDLMDWILASVPVLQAWYQTRWLHALENLLVLSAFAAVKLALRPIWARSFRGGEFRGSSVVSYVYHHDPELNRWFVRRTMSTLRGFLRATYWASVGAASGFAVLAGMAPQWPGFGAAAFPVLAALVLGECYFAVDGVTKAEAERDLAGERDDADRVVDYGALRAVLRETFPGSALSDGVHLSSPDATDSRARLDALAQSPLDVDRMGAAYFARVKLAGRPIDTNLMEASVGVMRGTSALINNPFYPDLTEYVCFPAYYYLLRYGKCLVVTGRDDIAGGIARWLDSGLEAITGIADLWKVEQLTDVEVGDIDVGVLRFADIHNLELLRSNDAFFSKVGFVVLAEPSRMLATGQLGLALLLSRCGRGTAPVFLAFDRNHDGLVDALSHLLKVNLTDVVASALPRGASSEVVWRTDGPAMRSVILPNVTRYLGMGTEIAAVALKYQVERVEWVGADAFPVRDMAWIAGQYFSQVNQFAELEMSQDALRDAIEPTGDPWGLAQQANRFLIVEDEFSNAFEALRLYLTRAQRHGFVNLISGDYLLRDYMVANREIFAADAKAVPSLVADFARTERNVLLRVILTMVGFELEETALAKEFELVGRLPEPRSAGEVDRYEESPTIRLLRELIERHTGVRDVSIACERRYVAGDEPDRRRAYYRIGPGSGLDAVVEALKPAYYFVEDEDEHANRIGSCLHGHVQQLFLPGQFLTHAGKYYEVHSIGGASLRDGVILRRAADHIRNRAAYRQLRGFKISQVRPAEASGSRRSDDGIEIVRGFAEIRVRSRGYLEMPSRSDLAAARRVAVRGLPPRSYTNKEVLEIRLPNVPDDVRRTITLLLNEMFVTLYPQAHPYLAAITPDPDRSLGDLLPGCRTDGAEGAIYIVEDSLVDLGLIVSVQRNLRRILEIAADYLAWHTNPPAEPATPEPTAEGSALFADLETPARPRRRSWWRRLLDAVRGWFTRSRPLPAEPQPELAPQPPTTRGPQEQGDAAVAADPDHSGAAAAGPLERSGEVPAAHPDQSTPLSASHVAVAASREEPGGSDEPSGAAQPPDLLTEESPPGGGGRPATDPEASEAEREASSRPDLAWPPQVEVGGTAPRWGAPGPGDESVERIGDVPAARQGPDADPTEPATTQEEVQ